jgi:predicted permease
MVHNIKFALRMFRRTPGFVLLVVLTLGLGIGGTTVLFSVVNAVLLSPLPYEESDRLVSIFNTDPRESVSRMSLQPSELMEILAAQSPSLDEVAAYTFGSYTTVGDNPEQVQARYVMSNFFSLLRVKPVLGRTFAMEDLKPGAGVAVLGHGLWQRRFGGNAEVLGKPLEFEGGSFTVLGIAPPGLRFPHSDTDVDLWLPLESLPLPRGADFRIIWGVGRLKPGSDLAQTQADMDTISRRRRIENPKSDTNLRVVSAKEDIVGSYRRPILVFFAGIALVLVIAVLNVANLLLVRAVMREREVAVRLAIGCTRLRLLRQLLAESTLLSLAGGAFGILVAFWSLDLILALIPDRLPRMFDIGFNPTVMAFTVALSVVAGIAFGLAPAFAASTSDLTGSLRGGTRQTSSGGARRLIRNALLAAEFAIAAVLLIGSTLTLKSFSKVLAIDPGAKLDNVVTVPIALSQTKYRDETQQRLFFNQVIERLRSLSGVEEAGFANVLPLQAGTLETVSIQGASPAAGSNVMVMEGIVTPEYFRVLGIPFQGRMPEPRRAEVAVNEAFVRHYFPGEDPIGRKITVVRGGPSFDPVTITGVVRDVRTWGLPQQPQPEIYVQGAAASWNLFVRTNADAAGMVTAIQREIRAVDSSLAVANIRTMNEIRSASVAEPRFRAVLMGMFAVLALLLAVVGICGITSHTVAQRRQEVAVRMALGAETGNVVGLIMRQSMVPIVIGTAAGLVACFGLTGLLRSFLFEVSPTDPFVYVVVPVLLCAVGALANVVSIRKGTRVDPVIALQCE